MLLRDGKGSFLAPAIETGYQEILDIYFTLPLNTHIYTEMFDSCEIDLQGKMNKSCLGDQFRNKGQERR